MAVLPGVPGLRVWPVLGRAAMLALALLAFSSWHAPAAAQQASRPDPDEVQRLLDALAAARSDLPTDSFVVEEALFATDLSVEGVFAWVRDSTKLVPYRGALRGPIGVLQDRMGNSLDRALLLQDLLDGLGYDSRLAHATLSDDLAAELLASVRNQVASSDSPEAVTAVDSLIAAFGLDAELVDTAVTVTLERARELSAALEERSVSQSEQIAALVGLSTVAVDTSHETELLDALSDHWWLQYQDGAAWLDLDPSLPSHEIGDTLSEPTDLQETFGVGGLPEELRHTLSLAVILECVADGALSEHILVATDRIDAASLSGIRSSVSVVPLTLPARGPEDVAALAEGLLAEKHWLPTITVGNESTSDLEFSPECKVGPQTPPWLGGAISDALTGALDALFGDDASAGGSVSALRIEYVLGRPGREDLVVRRDIFDNIGHAKREAGDLTVTEDTADSLSWRARLLGETEILVTASGLSDELVIDRTASALLAAGPQLIEYARFGTAPSSMQPESVAPSALYALALARQSRMPDQVYLGSLNIAQRHEWLAGSGAELAQRQAFDIVVNEVMSYAPAAEARAQRLAQGVVDTNAETLIAAQLCRDVATVTFCQVSPNPADQLADPTAVNGWSVIRTAAEADSALAGWPDDAKEGLKRDVEAGYTVLANAAAGISDAGVGSWWRVDPSSGSTLGVDSRGYGNVTAEYGMIVNFIGFAACEYAAVTSGLPIAGTVYCAFGFATGSGALVAGTGHAAGILSIVSALLYILGGSGHGGGN